MASAVSLRPLSDAVRARLVAAMAAEGAAGRWLPPEALSVPVDAEVGGGWRATWEVLDGDSSAGWVRAEVESHGPPGSASVAAVTVWVAPAHRGRGVGAGALRELRVVLAARGVRAVSALCSPRNTAAASALLAAGFCAVPPPPGGGQWCWWSAPCAARPRGACA